MAGTLEQTAQAERSKKYEFSTDNRRWSKVSCTGSRSDTKDNTGPGISGDTENGLNTIKEDMDSIFEEASALYQIPSKLLRAVAKAESGFNPKAVSKAGAMGVMQLMPGTARSLGVSDPYNARQNILGGAKYLKQNLDRFGGDVSLALAAYTLDRAV